MNLYRFVFFSISIVLFVTSALWLPIFPLLVIENHNVPAALIVATVFFVLYPILGKIYPWFLVLVMFEIIIILFNNQEYIGQLLNDFYLFLLQNYEICLLATVGVTSMLFRLLSFRLSWWWKLIAALVSVCILSLVSLMLRPWEFNVYEGAIYIGASCLFIWCVFDILMTRSSQKPVVIDKLGRLRTYKAKLRQIRKYSHELEVEKRGVGIAMAIYGEWGCGKTHFLNFLKERLSSKNKDFNQDEYNGKFAICEVCLWHCKSLDEALSSILNALYHAALGRSLICYLMEYKTGRILLETLSCIWPSALNFKSILTLVEKPDIWVSDEAIEKLSSAMGERRAILILDDIERANPCIVKKLFPIIERLKRIKKLTVICSIAPDELEIICSKHFDEEKLHGYLTKVFDVTYFLPSLSLDVMRDRIFDDLENGRRKYPLLRKFFAKTSWKFDSPRQLERTLERWKNIEEQYFSGCDEKFMDHISPDFLNRVYCVFATEVLRMYAVDVFKDIKKSAHMHTFIDDTFEPNMYAFKHYKYKGSGEMVDSAVVNSALFCLRFVLPNFTENDLKYVFEMEYAKRRGLNEFELEEMIVERDYGQKACFEHMISEYLKDEYLEGGCIKHAVGSLIKHSMLYSHQDEKYSNVLSCGVSCFASECLSKGTSFYRQNSECVIFVGEFIDIYPILKAENRGDNLISLFSSSLEKLSFDSFNDAFYYACSKFRKYEEDKLVFRSKDEIDIISSKKYAPVLEAFYDAFAKRFCDLIANYKSYAYDVWEGDGSWLLELLGIDKCVEKLKEQIGERLELTDEKMQFLLNSLSVLLIQYKISNKNDEVSLVLPENIAEIYKGIFSKMLILSCGNKRFVQSCMIVLNSCMGYMENIKYADEKNYPQRLQGKSALLIVMKETYDKLQAQAMADLESGKIKGIVQMS